MSELPEYVLERSFDAPRDLVWRAWTEPEFLARWYGPGVETVIHKFELKPGGLWLNEMKWGDKSNRSKMEFKDVTPPEKLTWLHSSTDADWNVAPNPMMENWPQQMLHTITFTETGGKTSVRLAISPVDASEAEIACFAEAMGNMDHGWGKGYAVLDEVLAEMLATG
ncbi:MAG: SRPBCC domain-containing protein [Pseudomonadota bacterium]